MGCQLHQWALGGKKKKNASLIDYSYFKVTLCAELFLPFTLTVDDHSVGVMGSSPALNPSGSLEGVVGRLPPLERMILQLREVNRRSLIKLHFIFIMVLYMMGEIPWSRVLLRVMHIKPIGLSGVRSTGRQ